MTAALIITVGLIIVFSGFALGMFAIGTVVGHSWSPTDYLRNKAHHRNRRSKTIITAGKRYLPHYLGGDI